MRRMSSKSLVGVMIAVGLASSANATIVTLRSGNGSIGGTDSFVTFLDGPNATDFGVLTAANFSSAQTGLAASIITANGAWISSLAEDAAAKWIGDNSGAASNGNTALYAESFGLFNPVVSATITVHYAVDNSLGGTNNLSGLFLNGTALSPAPNQAGFSGDFSYTNSSVGSLLHSGTNFIYFDAVNGGGPAGIIYTVTITTVDGTTSGTPEPATFGLFGGAVLLLAAGRRFRKTA